MTEKRYIMDTDCLMNMVLDTRFGFYGLDEPTELEIMDKDYFVVCTMHSRSEAKEVCERLNKYEQENKKLKAEIESLREDLGFVDMELEEMRVDLE